MVATVALNFSSSGLTKILDHLDLVDVFCIAVGLVLDVDIFLLITA